MKSEEKLGINFANQHYVLEQYEAFQRDPGSVSKEFRFFFEGFDFAENQPEMSAKSAESTPKAIRILRLLEGYKRYGHLASITNPMKYVPDKVKLLSLEANGFTEAEKDTLFPTMGILPEKEAPLSEIVKKLNRVYCRTIGFECYGIENSELERWFHERILGDQPIFSREKKIRSLKELCRAKFLEEFLHKRFIGAKRFSIEGGEPLLPMLREALEEASRAKYPKAVICMAHRGRLNVLCNILQKPYSQLMREFNTEILPGFEEGMGDVKYHKGFCTDYQTEGGESIEVTLAPNPSHLESVDPVMMGMTKGLMHKTKERVLPIMIHGDAAVAGQGIVYEVMQLSQLKGYQVGGVVHIVVNNQIGFTATPDQSRSTRYCTDIAKAFGAPVIHVNAEDVEASLYAMQLALEVQGKFGIDVFIDLGCYRQYGHNEGDEPVFTNPHLYGKIKTKEHLYRSYRSQLINEKILDETSVEKIEEEIKAGLNQAFDEAKVFAEKAPKEKACPTYHYLEMFDRSLFTQIETKLPLQQIHKIAETLNQIPEEFNAHPKIRKIYEERKAALLADPLERKIDWGCAETLAYASLLEQGGVVRISGQDSQRGTFSHRHSVLYDQKEENVYIPLTQMNQKESAFQVYNSALSEYGVLGYEFGYSLSYPEALTIWEAQFGDFSNGAQIIFDQYIVSAETKWGINSRLTLFLPHGYEGMGSEHSSCRVERILQMAALYNLRICYPTTPAQFFHVLRKQALQEERKPLVVLTPKSMLRYPPSFSSTKDLSEGSFQTVIDDTVDPEKVDRILFCTGKIYYELIAKREEKGNIAVVRIESLYPLDLDRIRKIVGKYKNAGRFAWVQEEPSNQGFWDYIRPYLVEVIGGYEKLEYVGRVRSSSPATGFVSLHKKEQKEIIDKALRD